MKIASSFSVYGNIARIIDMNDNHRSATMYSIDVWIISNFFRSAVGVNNYLGGIYPFVTGSVPDDRLNNKWPLQLTYLSE